MSTNRSSSTDGFSSVRKAATPIPESLIRCVDIPFLYPTVTESANEKEIAEYKSRMLSLHQEMSNFFMDLGTVEPINETTSDSDTNSDITASIDETDSDSDFEDEYIETRLGKIRLFHEIGAGTFGKVYKGMLTGRTVAVKILKPRAESSWETETFIYSMRNLKNSHILDFFGSVREPDRLLLVTEYHWRGSLYDFIFYNTINVEQLVYFTVSIVCGLIHLHSDIPGKSAIAHRDLKTGNILVKSDGSCCIADFGCALTHVQLLSTAHIYCKVGTVRYMAPEVLNNSVATKSIESFLKTDIYALGLIFWELCRRTVSSDNEVDDFMLAFDDALNIVDEENLRREVCVNKVRPKISPRWNSDYKINEIMKTAEKCWEQNPTDRPSILQLPVIEVLFSWLSNGTY